MTTKKRSEFKQIGLIDRMHTLLAADCEAAGDKARAEWHIKDRDYRRWVWNAAYLKVIGYHPMDPFRDAAPYV